MAKRFLSLLLVVICATLHAMAQLITVKGNVVDKAAEPIIGASVTIAGTTKGTVTDIDGIIVRGFDRAKIDAAQHDKGLLA